VNSSETQSVGQFLLSDGKFEMEALDQSHPLQPCMKLTKDMGHCFVCIAPADRSGWKRHPGYLPAAANWRWGIVAVENINMVAVSDGTSWRRLDKEAIL
jgi:hypothetical protein